VGLLQHQGDDVEEPSAVQVVEEDVAARHAARPHVVQRAGLVEAGTVRHTRRTLGGGERRHREFLTF
jgi:hypothetical protein